MGFGQGTMETVVGNTKFWQGKRVFVTGHTGFKGAWLSLWLQRLGAVVTGYSLAPPTDPNLFEVAHVASGMQSVIGDITDLPFMLQSLAQARPEIVFHLAAQSLVRYGYAKPVETFAANVMGTVNLLEACRFATSVRAVVVITTDKCYENREWVWGYRENDPMGGHDPYSSSKGCAELAAAAYRCSYFSAGSSAQIATTRAGNVIGGGDWAADRLVPDLIRAFASGQSARIRYPTAIRPWQHVLEPLRGYLLLAQCLCASLPDRYAGAWNFGPEDAEARPVAWIADRLVRLWGAGVFWQSDDSAHPHEAGTLKLDCSKAHALLGWQPRLCLENALEWIVAWHHAYRDGHEMREFTLEQIKQYESIGSSRS
jgi:CDP-glucose 4,6-dehydratase